MSALIFMGVWAVLAGTALPKTSPALNLKSYDVFKMFSVVG
jgi:hypothetical protein